MIESTIAEIQRIRSRNNVAWVDILRTAMKAAPKETKFILKRITENDKKIAALLGTLAND